MNTLFIILSVAVLLVSVMAAACMMFGNGDDDYEDYD